MGFEIVPFEHCEDVIVCLPHNHSKNITWFTITPKFTTLRINTLKYSSDEVAESIKRDLKEESQKLGLNEVPDVYIHPVFKDCLIIGPRENVNLRHLSNCGEVIIDVPCGNAVLRGAHIFAPGVLSLPINAQEGDNVNIYVDLKGKCCRGLLQNFSGEKLFIGQGVVKIDRTTLFTKNAKINGIAVEVTFRTSNIPSLKFPNDFGLLQNLPSLVCSYVLQPTCDSNVLDMCASPGNKTTHIAILMKNKGKVFAIDKSENKISKITTLTNLYGLTNVVPCIGDSTKILLNSKGNNETTIGPPFCKESFNRILLDAPCSALGHRPNLYNKITYKQLKSYINLQRKLFHNAVELLRPGGILVYSTCTITIEENEGLVKWALDKFKNIRLSKATPYIGSPGLIESGLTDIERSYVQRFDMKPGDTPETDTIGFFIAKFIKDVDKL